MSRMPLLSLVLYIATRVALYGQAIDESLIELFGRAGLLFASREILAECSN